MRRFVLFAGVLLAILAVPVAGYVLAQSNPPAGAKVTICHITDSDSGEGHVISIADNAPALNAHIMLHGDCLDFEDLGDGGCACGDGSGSGGDDDGDDDSDSDDDDQ